MIYNYRTKGVCSKEMHIELNDDHTIKHVEVIGGCNGNLQGISRLVEGMKAEDAIERMRGIRCGFKNTSCPDQLSIALAEALAQKKQEFAQIPAWQIPTANKASILAKCCLSLWTKCRKLCILNQLPAIFMRSQRNFGSAGRPAPPA